MVENVPIRAAGFFQGIGQDGHKVEGSVIVDCLGQLMDGAVVPRQPCRIDRYRSYPTRTTAIHNPNPMPSNTPFSFLYTPPTIAPVIGANKNVIPINESSSIFLPSLMQHLFSV